MFGTNPFESIRERIEEAESGWENKDYDDEVDLTEDIARPALLALSELVALVNDLREAGADIAEIPQEMDALVTVITNGSMIAASIKADVEHLAQIVERVGAKP